MEPVFALVGEPDPVAAGATAGEAFAAFVAGCEPGLRRALVAAFGPEIGREAAAEALARVWPRWDRVSRMRNPAGYVFQVGRNIARRRLRRDARGRVLEAREVQLAAPPGLSGEPGLAAALDRLSERQRRAVLLVHGYGYTLGEAATTMGCSPSTVRNHVQRGMARLRVELGVEENGDE